MVLNFRSGSKLAETCQVEATMKLIEEISKCRERKSKNHPPKKTLHIQIPKHMRKKDMKPDPSNVKIKRPWLNQLSV